MSKLLERRNFTNTDLEKNSNKFWIISRFDDNSVETHYGRVGVTGEKTVKNFPSDSKAKAFFESKIRDKLRVKEGRRDCYTEIHIVDDTVVTTGVNRDIIELAAQEIETEFSEVRDLVRWFGKINVHNIVSSTTIKYNIAEGCFRTPLGVVDQVCIRNAKLLLNEISQFTDKKEKECLHKINQYLRMIPQDLGGSHVKIHVEDVFGSGELLQKQADIIEGLEAAISQATPGQSSNERVFKTKIDKVEDEKTTLDLEKQFRRHTPYSRISNIYSISVEDVVSHYVKYGKTIGNSQLLFHATSPRNILSICKSGLVIPTKYSNGWNHGAGVYFSDRSSKSMQYLTKDNRNGRRYGYMFLADVALGNVLYDNGRSLPSGNYNCRWAYRESDESQIIIYDVRQCNLLYLLEIED